MHPPSSSPAPGRVEPAPSDVLPGGPRPPRPPGFTKPPSGGGAVLAALAVAGLLVRAEAFHLPLSGAGAEVAAATRGLAEARLAAPPGGGLLTAWLAFLPHVAGLSATTAVRLVETLAGAALAPLAAVLARRTGARGATAVVVGLLTLLHPSLSIAAGGAADHGLALAALLFTAAILRRDAPGLVEARQVGVAGALVSVGAPYGLLAAVPLLVHHARRETSPTLRWLPGAVSLLAFALLPGARGTSLSGLGAVEALVALVLVAAGPLAFGLLPALSGAPGLPGRVLGWGSLAAAALLYGLADLVAPAVPGAGPLAVAPLVIPLLLVLGARGLARVGPVWASRARLVTLALGALATLLLAVPAAGRLWPAGAESTAARARWLERAAELAAEAAGPGGLVAFAAPASEAERASAADGLPGGVEAVSEGASGDERRAGHLKAFDALAFDAQRTLGLVARVGTLGPVHALGGGAVLFRFTEVKTFGPYVVLRARRD
ncbi:MAG: hypothetical protein AB7T63_14715 [Planctomycetota bacterium]